MSDKKIIKINRKQYLLKANETVEFIDLIEKFGDFTKIFLSLGKIILLYGDILKYRQIGSDERANVIFYEYTTVKIDNVKKVLYCCYDFGLFVLKNNGELYVLNNNGNMNLILENIDDIQDNYTIISNNKLCNIFIYGSNNHTELKEAFDLPLKFKRSLKIGEDIFYLYKYDNYYYYQNSKICSEYTFIPDGDYIIDVKKYYFDGILIYLHDDDCVYNENNVLIKKNVKKIIILKNNMICVNLDNTIDSVDTDYRLTRLDMIWQDKFKFIKSARN